MKSRSAILCFLLTSAFVTACNKSSNSPQVSEAQPINQPSQSAGTFTTPASGSNFAPGSDADRVRQAVEDHVRGDRGINLSAMDMSVDSVNIAGNEAQASATFRVKQGGAAMVMVYSLERHGSGWLVTKDQPADGQFVHPPMDQTHSGMSGAQQPNSSGSEMPNVREFLKTHPATTNSSQVR